MTKFRNHLIRFVMASTFLISGIAAADSVLEEVIVTAQKREQSLQQVGLTITAFDGKSIIDQRLDEPYQLAAAIPNLQAFDKAGGTTHFRIRGLGLNEFQVSFDSPVAINVDEVILSKPFMASMGFFDIQRVEVLKGPQGTVFGRNTTGGAVNYFTNRPTDEFEAGVRGTYGKFDRFEFNAYVSGPLSENLSGRVAISGARAGVDEGPYFNVFNGKYIGTRDDKNLIRGQLQWTSDTTTILATAHYGKQEGELPPYDNLFQDIPGGAQAGGITDLNKVIRDPIGRFTVNSDYFPIRDNTAYGSNLRIDHDLGWATLTSLTAYEYFERDQREDSDNTPVASVNIDWYSKIDQLSQELRLSGERDKWNYLVGIYYENDDLTEIDTIDLGPLRAGSDYRVVTDTWAIFTNNEYVFNDQFSLTAGARYTEEKNDFVGLSFLATGLPGPPPENRVDPSTYFPGLVPNNVSRKDTDFNLKVGLNYYPSDNVMLFTSYSTGFRSGGFDVGLVADKLMVFIPEDVTAVEAGIKTTLLNDTLNANVSFFFTEVENYQENANLPTELTPRRRNIGTLETKGIEVDMHWKPTDRWLIRASAGYADAKIVKTDFLIGDIPIRGNRPANSPKYSTNTFASYLVPLSTSLDLEFIASWTWIDKRFLEVENQEDHLVSSYSIVDARIGLGANDGKWRVSIWGRNLTDKIHATYINDVPGFGLFLLINSDPRTFGVSVDYNF